MRKKEIPHGEIRRGWHIQNIEPVFNIHGIDAVHPCSPRLTAYGLPRPRRAKALSPWKTAGCFYLVHSLPHRIFLAGEITPEPHKERYMDRQQEIAHQGKTQS